MRLEMLAALALGLGMACGSANAAPIASPPAVQFQSDAELIPVAGGCGPGWHRGPWGGCKPNGYWGPPRYYGPRYYGPPRYYGGYYGPKCVSRPTPYGWKRVCRY